MKKRPHLPKNSQMQQFFFAKSILLCCAQTAAPRSTQQTKRAVFAVAVLVGGSVSIVVVVAVAVAGGGFAVASSDADTGESQANWLSLPDILLLFGGGHIGLFENLKAYGTHSCFLLHKCSRQKFFNKMLLMVFSFAFLFFFFLLVSTQYVFLAAEDAYICLLSKRNCDKR